MLEQLHFQSSRMPSGAVQGDNRKWEDDQKELFEKSETVLILQSHTHETVQQMVSHTQNGAMFVKKMLQNF